MRIGVDSAIYGNQGSVLDMLCDPHLLLVVLLFDKLMSDHFVCTMFDH